MTDPQQILDFWFGPDTDALAIAERQAPLWWAKNEDIDAIIRERFEIDVQSAASGQRDAWQASPSGRLALILLTDQFPRNIYRDTPQAFAFDPQARRLCEDGLTLGHDRALRPIERVFFYLPLEHSESRRDQARCVALMRELSNEVAPAQRALFDGYVDFALRHQVIVDRFGRFPHRNPLLGRESTVEEREFLQGPDSAF